MPLLPVQEAIAHAEHSLKKFYPQASGMRLEEFEPLDTNGPRPRYLVTLSFTLPGADPSTYNPGTLGAIAALSKFRREYKVLELDANDGTFIALRMREAPAS
jgi:hypothetical protein